MKKFYCQFAHQKTIEKFRYFISPHEDSVEGFFEFLAAQEARLGTNRMVTALIAKSAEIDGIPLDIIELTKIRASKATTPADRAIALYQGLEPARRQSMK